MKKLFLLACSSLLAAMAVHAQCGKNITWTTPKTEYLDANGTVQRVDNSPVALQTTASHITVNFKQPNGEPDVIEGDIENLHCDWKEAFKNGKTSFKARLAKQNGETKNAAISIEGIDGKITITVELENTNGVKLRMPVTDYKIAR